MPRWSVLGALVGACVVVAAALAWWLAPRVQGHLEDRARATLDDAGLEDVRVRAHGRALVLSGRVAYPVLKDKAARVVAGWPVGAVDVAGVLAAGGRSGATTSPPLLLEKRDEGWHVQGSWPSTDAARAAREVLTAVVGREVVGDWTLDEGAVAPTLDELALLAVTVGGTAHGTLRWSSEEVTLEARDATGRHAAAARRVLVAVAGERAARVHVTAVPGPDAVGLALDVVGRRGELWGVAPDRLTQRRLTAALREAGLVDALEDLTVVSATPVASAGDVRLAEVAAGLGRAEVLRVREDPRGLAARAVVRGAVGDLAARVRRAVGDVDLRLDVLGERCPASVSALPLPGPGAAGDVEAALAIADRCPALDLDLRAHPAVRDAPGPVARAVRRAELAWALAEAGAFLERWLPLAPDSGARRSDPSNDPDAGAR